MVISIPAKFNKSFNKFCKSFTKFNTFMIKTLNELGTEVNYCNTINPYVKTSQLTSYSLGEAFPLRSRASGQGWSLMPLLFNTVLKILLRAIRHKRELKEIHLDKN